MAQHRTMHFGGQLVHPGQSFAMGEDPGGNRVYLSFTTDTRSVTTLKRSSSPVEGGVRVSELRWNGDQLGVWVSTTRSIDREFPMRDLAEVTRRPLGMRAFMSNRDDDTQSSFLWVRLPGANGDAHSYNLVDEQSGIEVGRYRHHGPIVSPNGTLTYARFEYLDAMGRII